ncbi:MAG: alpha/beta hydrolase [Moraxellaceae bacterium]|jgi:pimeloyl-ACP methyl ester carboxylesterase|nr:alpha/beta hydrolase [Moraxellaceae bacterium]
MKRATKGLLIAAAVLLLALAGITAAVWAPDRSVAELSAKWAPLPSQFITVNGMQVHLRDEGPREDPLPIVLLHGTSASLHTWDGWTAELAKTRRVIRFDMPGFGLTGPAPDNDYALASYVKFVTGVADALALQKFVLAGNSLGGRIAWEVALAHPGRVEKLILVDAGGYPLGDNSMPIGFRIAMTPGLSHLMDYTLPRAMVASSVRDVYGDPAKVTPALVDRYYDLTLRAGNRAALRERFKQQDFADESARIRQLRQPTLVIWGRKDKLLLPSFAERFGRDIANSEVVMFDALGHVPHEEDPQATLAPVLKFL